MIVSLVKYIVKLVYEQLPLKIIHSMESGKRELMGEGV